MLKLKVKQVVPAPHTAAAVFANTTNKQYMGSSKTNGENLSSAKKIKVKKRSKKKVKKVRIFFKKNVS